MPGLATAGPLGLGGASDCPMSFTAKHVVWTMAHIQVILAEGIIWNGGLGLNPGLFPANLQTNPNHQLRGKLRSIFTVIYWEQRV